MRYTMRSPCDSCPFVAAHDFPLHPERIQEIMDHAGSGFPCHKTTDVWGDPDDPDNEEDLAGADRSKWVHCAGSLILQWFEWGGFDGIVAWELSKPDGVRVPEGWSPETHLDLEAGVWSSLEEWLEYAEAEGW